MQNSRDSSVWRSLAVAFGDGVAFGVGMKLTQGAGRQADAPSQPSQPDTSPVADRLERIEQRLARMEQAPRAIAAVPPGPAFDQKVLETVVNALDARLKEHAGQVERRLAELEAKMTIELNSLRQQDHSSAAAAQSRVEEVHSQLQEQVAAVRNSVEEDLTEFAAAVTRMVEERTAAAVTAQIGPLERQMREELEAAAGRASDMAESAAGAAIEGKLAPIREEVSDKDRELAELRQRMADNDRAVLDTLLAVGEVCCKAAERIGGKTPSPPESAAPPDAAAPAGDAANAPGRSGDPGGGPVRLLPAEARSGAEPNLQNRPWRIPLVSSFMLTTASLLLLHYL